MQSTTYSLNKNYQNQIMKRIYHSQRCAAAQEFQQSLMELEDILQDNSHDNQIITEVNDSNILAQKMSENTDDIDLAALEDAVADIEHYLEEKHKKHHN